MKKRILYIVVIIGMLIISSCSTRGKENAEKLPGIDIPLNEMNSTIMLEPDPGMPTVHKNGETLGFLIRNRSLKTFIFSQDFGIKIFQKQGSMWELVENKWGYPEGENILPTSNESPVGLAFFVFPDIVVIDEPTDVRIVVVGHQRDKPTEQVAAYYDVQYGP